jgi:hypothetical protein
VTAIEASASLRPNTGSTGAEWRWCLVALVAVATLLHAPHLLLKVADTNNDFFLHHFWVKSFSDSVLAGDPYPRWVPEARFELGEPVFLYYAPLYYWAATAFVAVGLAPWAAMQAVDLAGSLVLGGFVYAALRSHVGFAAALGGALAAVLSPPLIGVAYKFNGFPWSFALCLFGPLLWAVLRPGFQPTRPDWRVALAIGLITLAHTVSGLMALLFFTIAQLTMALAERTQPAELFRRAVAWTVTVTLGLALSGLYLVPALTSMSYIDSEAWTTSYTPWQSFAFPTWTAARHGMNWPAFQWPLALWATCTLAVGIWGLWRLARISAGTSTGVTRSTVFLAALGGSALFFATELSYPLWTLDTPLRKIQYPWRSITLVALAATLIAAMWFGQTLRSASSSRFIRLAAGSLLGLGIALGAASAFIAGVADGKPVHPAMLQGEFTHQEFKREFESRTDCESRGLKPDDCIATNRIAAGYRGLPEYRAAGFRKEAIEAARAGLASACADAGVTCRRLQDGASAALSVALDAPSPASLRLPVLDFPAWKVEIDGRELAHATDPETGLLRVQVPAGSSQLRVRWQRLPQEKLGLAVSLAASLVVVVLAVAGRRRS